MTKREKMWAWIAGIGAALGLGGAVVYESVKHSSSSPATQQLVPGHRYKLVLSCPSVIPLPPPPIPDSVVLGLVGIPNISIVHFETDSAGKGFTVEFDYTGVSPLPLPPIQASGATACQTQLSDMGATPTGGFGGHGFSPPQQVSVQAGSTAQASAIAGSTIQITAPGPITNVFMGGAGTLTGSGGNQATATLNGHPGSIAVIWQITNPNPPNNLIGQSGSIKVS